VAVGAVHVDDGVSEGGVAGDDLLGDLLGFVGGVVEDLDFELFGGVVHGADGFEEALDDELLVVHGQLDGDARQFFEVGGRVGLVILAVLVVEVDERIAMDAVDGEDDHDGEIGDQERGVEGVPG
jgi:hypothetical protein